MEGLETAKPPSKNDGAEGWTRRASVPGRQGRRYTPDATDKFYLPAYIASKGWVALRLDRGKVDWGEVGELVTGSYRLIVPKRLAAGVG